jgi:beta-xylosidase
MHAPTRRLRGLVLALVAAVVAAACAGDATAPRTATSPEHPSPPASDPASPATPQPDLHQFTNPVHAGDFPDPFVLRAGRFYYAYATNIPGANIPVIRSIDLTHWDPVGDALPALPPWAPPHRSLTWAPSVVEVAGRYVLFYTARDTRSGRQCLGRAEAGSPAGPFVDRSSVPFLCQPALGGSIDPEPFRDADGSLYLVWKNDGNCCRLRVSLWSQRLSDDASTLVGSPAELVHRDQGWEGPLIEGPSMWHDGGSYYLLYSANWYDSDRYAVGYALCASPLGPCHKPLDHPIMSTAAGAAGPGGETFFTDASGGVWLAYHAWSQPAVGYAAGGARSLRLDRVSFEAGAIVIHGPTTTPQPAN